MSFDISATGTVKSPTGTGVSPEVAKCVSDVIAGIEFPKPRSGSAHVTYPFSFSLGGGSLRGWGSELVLTRLHARYGKQITEDLVFKKADPIVGGREFVLDNGVLEQTARPDTHNNFQARYAIRHLWTGPISCANPQRYVWGGPTSPDAEQTKPTAATGLAFAARTGTALRELVKRDVPEIAMKATSPAPYAVPANIPDEPPPADAGAGTGSALAKPKATTRSGCGCDSGGGAGGVVYASLIALALFGRRRRQTN